MFVLIIQQPNDRFIEFFNSGMHSALGTYRFHIMVGMQSNADPRQFIISSIHLCFYPSTHPYV